MNIRLNFVNPGSRLPTGAAFLAAALVVASGLPALAAPAAASAPNAPPANGLDPADMDTSAAACSDFYQYADGGWLKSNPIPGDQPRWGGSDALQLRNLDALDEILDKLVAAPPAAPGTEERKIADFYGSCMDEATIEAQGIKPLASHFAAIDAIHDVRS